MPHQVSPIGGIYIPKICWFFYSNQSDPNYLHRQYLSILSPTFVAMLITRMSGIPLLEAHGMKKWGHLAEYQNYIKNTPELIPFF